MKFKNDSSQLVLSSLVEQKGNHPHLKVMIAPIPANKVKISAME